MDPTGQVKSTTGEVSDKISVLAMTELATGCRNEPGIAVYFPIKSDNLDSVIPMTFIIGDWKSV